MIITMDDSTSEHYSMFFTEEEGTMSSFRGVRDVILEKGLFGSLYTDRGSHYRYTPKEGGKVGKTQMTQFGRAMKTLGIRMIAAYSPEARGHCERAFGTHQDRLARELSFHGISKMDATNRYLSETYRRSYNAEFMIPASEEGTGFVPWIGGNIDDILCEQDERTVGADNCVSFEGKNFEFRQINIVVTTSGSEYVSISIRMVLWQSSTVRENWLIMTGKEISWNSEARADRICR